MRLICRVWWRAEDNPACHRCPCPISCPKRCGFASILSCRCPGGVPVATMAIGEAGATNAALTALRILSIEDQTIAAQLVDLPRSRKKLRRLCQMNSSKTIGIIGGGQLGQMMAISAIYMGHKVITLDPAADCPASKVSEIIRRSLSRCGGPQTVGGAVRCPDLRV